MKQKKPKRVVLVDSDILVFRIAAICESRSVEVTHKKSGKVKTFKNKTSFKDFLKEKDFDYIESDYEFVDLQTINDEMSYRYLIDNQIKSIKETLWPDEIRFLISGKDNFRDLLPLPVKYKGNRDGALKPLLRSDCRNHLIGKYKATVVNGEEVDDTVIWMGYEELAKGHEVIIVTNDKDASAYSGLSLYNYTVDNPEIVKIPDLGKLWLDDKGKVRGIGLIWYCLQHLCADKTDGMNTANLSGVKFGEKSAYTLLRDCTSEAEALGLVIAKYREWFSNTSTNYVDYLGQRRKINWLGAADLYFKGIRMREVKNDPLDFKTFANKWGHVIEDETINELITE